MVGVIGPNTAGKSTLLTFLKYVWDGELPDDNQETYVRGWGKEGMPTNGSVRIRFRKHGAPGQIFRQFGKTSRRWLEWGDRVGDKKITKQAEVEKTISEIFGADRKALSKAIFVPQGAFDKLFFGKDSERETLLTQLLVLGHLEKIEHVFDGKIKAHSAGVTDLSMLLDTANTRRAEAEDKLNYLEGEVAKYRDWSLDLAALREYTQVVNEGNTALTQEEYFTQQAADVKTRLQGLLAQPVAGKVFGSLDELQHFGATNREHWTELSKRHGAVTQRQLTIERIDTLRSQERKANNIMEVLGPRIDELDPVATTPLAPLLTQVHMIREWQAAAAEQEAAMHAMLTAGKALSDFDTNTAVPDANNVGEYQYQIDDMLRKHTELHLKFELRSRVMNQTDHTECPICDQPLDPRLVSQPLVEGLAAEIELIKQQGQAIRQKQRDLQAQLRVFNETRARLAGESGAAGQRFQKAAAACGRRPEGDIDEIEKRIAAVRAAVVEIKDAREQNRLALQARDEALAALKAFSFDDQCMYDTGDRDFSELHKLNAEIAKVQKIVGQIEERIQNCTPLDKEFAEAHRLVVENIKVKTACFARATELRAAFSPQLNATIVEANPEQVLEEKVQTRQQMIGEARQAKEQADRIRDEQNALIARSDEDGVRRALLDDLKKLRAAFIRQGLPMRFVRHKFEKLVEMTRINLAKMEANFTVDVDPTASVSFTFTMLGEDDPYVMPQSKLSGGQKVRLSIAFLLAVQQLIIPEVGFMVLDEPSLHLDIEGKESLRDMLSNMSGELTNGQSQIWVCDHEPLLESAYGKIIRLKKSEQALT